MTPEASKVRPRGLRGTSRTPFRAHWALKMEAQGGIWTSKWRSGGPFRPQNGGLGVRSKKFRKTMEFSTRVHKKQLDICTYTRPNVDKTRRAWVANSSKDVRSEGGNLRATVRQYFQTSTHPKEEEGRRVSHPARPELVDTQIL